MESTCRRWAGKLWLLTRCVSYPLFFECMLSFIFQALMSVLLWPHLLGWYLMQIDHRHPAVQEDLKTWGSWVIQASATSGLVTATLISAFQSTREPPEDSVLMRSSTWTITLSATLYVIMMHDKYAWLRISGVATCQRYRKQIWFIGSGRVLDLWVRCIDISMENFTYHRGQCLQTAEENGSLWGRGTFIFTLQQPLMEECIARILRRAPSWHIPQCI